MTSSPTNASRGVSANADKSSSYLINKNELKQTFCDCETLPGVAAIPLDVLPGVPAMLLVGRLEIGEAMLDTGLLDKGELALKNRIVRLITQGSYGKTMND